MPIATGLLQRKCACGTHASGGECEDCKKNKGMLQRQSSVAADIGATPSTANVVRNFPGQSLDPQIRNFMEARLGNDRINGRLSGGMNAGMSYDTLEREADTSADHVMHKPVGMIPRLSDFSDVRIHHDEKAAQSADGIDAAAYTVGRDIVFGSGQYDPSSRDGKKLIAHELTHVLQQRQLSNSVPSLQMQPKGGQQKTTKSKPTGKISLHFDKKLTDLYLWPNAWGSIGWVQSLAIGKEVTDQLIASGAQINVIFVAERTDIPYSTYDVQGFTDEIGGGAFDIYVLAGQEEPYFERTPSGSMLMKTRIRSRSQEDIAGTLFHELLHAWFMMYFPNAALHTGHKGGATPLGDPKFDPTGYDPEFLSRLQRFESEMQKLKAKLKPQSGQTP